MIVDVHTRVWDATACLGRANELMLRRRGEPWQRPDPSAPAHDAAMEKVQLSIVHGFESRHLDASIPPEKLAEFVRARRDRVIGFAGIDPTAGKPVKELERALSLGMQGVTISPAGQAFHPSDSRAMALYEACEARGVPVFVDSVQLLCRDAMLEFAQPYLLDEVARTFPKLRIVITGLGHPWIEQGLALLAKHPTVYAVLGELILHPWRVYNALLLAYQHGVMNQILFGSNFPFLTPEKAIITIYSLNTFAHGTNLPTIPREQLRMVVEHDAVRSLGLKMPEGAADRPAASPQPQPVPSGISEDDA